MNIIIRSLSILLLLLQGSVGFCSSKDAALPIFDNNNSEYGDHSNNGKFFEDDIVFGNKDSKVVVVEYFSLTCPHCAYFHKEIFPAFKEKFIDTNKIAFVKREFVGGKQDLESAILARCGGNMKRMALYDVLLDRQENWAFNKKFSEILTNIGQMAGISPEQFKSCLEDEKLGTRLMNNTKLIARTPGFTGTPAFVINNKLSRSGFSLDDLSKEIDAAFKEADSAVPVETVENLSDLEEEKPNLDASNISKSEDNSAKNQEIVAKQKPEYKLLGNNAAILLGSIFAVLIFLFIYLKRK